MKIKEADLEDVSRLAPLFDSYRYECSDELSV